MRRKILIFLFSILSVLFAVLVFSSFGSVSKAADVTSGGNTTTTSSVTVTAPSMEQPSIVKQSEPATASPATGTTATETTPAASADQSTSTSNTGLLPTVSPSTNSSTMMADTDTAVTPTTPTVPAVPAAKKVIPMTGNTAEDAVTTDGNGNVIPPENVLYTWQRFGINYNWSIPDGVEIQNGDTADFQLPGNIVAATDLSFDIKDSHGTVIGTYAIKKGSQTGTLTFNNALENTTANRKGQLSLKAKGSTEDTSDPGSFVINKNGWVPDQKALGDNSPTKLTWNVAFNSDGRDWTNIYITETLPEGVTFLPDSVYAETGKYQNGWQSSGTIKPDSVTASPDGRTVVFYFKHVTTAVDMRFQTSINEGVDPHKINTWVNNVHLQGDQAIGDASHKIEWGGEGTGDGDRDSVVMTKTSTADGSVVSGAIYDLLDAQGNVIMESLVTDENGQIVLQNLKPGDYILREESSGPGGFVPSTNRYPFTVVAGQTTQVSAIDTPYVSIPEPPEDDDRGIVIIFKVDSSTNEKLPGATFNVLDSNGKAVKIGLITDAKGKIAILDLPDGSYTLVETAAPDDYAIDSTPIKFDVVLNQVTNLEVPDKIDPDIVVPPAEDKEGTLVIFKVDSANAEKPIQGAYFKIIDANGNVVQNSLKTNEKGEIVVSDLADGKYTLQETMPAEGYAENPTVYPFEITAGRVTNVTVPNDEQEIVVPPIVTPPDPGTDDKTGTLLVLKVDSKVADKVLSGATFQILDTDGKVIRDNLTTDEKGELTVADLADGTYILKETIAPEGYELNSETSEFTVKSGEVVKLTVGDNEESGVEPTDPEDGSLVVLKVDSVDPEKALEGAIFKIVDAKGELVKDGLTTNEKGEIIVENLADGQYSLIETTAPKGYEVNSTPLDFTIVAGKVTDVKVSDTATSVTPEPPVGPTGEEPGVTVPGPTKPNIPTPSIPGGTAPTTKSDVSGTKPESDQGGLPQTSNDENNLLTVLGVLIISLFTILNVLDKVKKI